MDQSHTIFSLSSYGLKEVKDENTASELAKMFPGLIYFFAEFDTGEEYHDENTLQKVYDVLDGVQSISYTAEDIISMLQNEGILFRERAPHV